MILVTCNKLLSPFYRLENWKSSLVDQDPTGFVRLKILYYGVCPWSLSRKCAAIHQRQPSSSFVWRPRLILSVCIKRSLIFMQQNSLRLNCVRLQCFHQTMIFQYTSCSDEYSPSLGSEGGVSRNNQFVLGRSKYLPFSDIAFGSDRTWTAQISQYMCCWKATKGNQSKKVVVFLKFRRELPRQY